MIRAAELFAVATVIVILAGFLASSAPGVSVHFRNTAYVFPARYACFIIAGMLAFFAAVYSLWMLRINDSAALSHFWLTAISIIGFWAFLMFLGKQRTIPAVAAIAVSGTAFLTAQLIFAVALGHAVYRGLTSGGAVANLR
jgi:hypothetical protein